MATLGISDLKARLSQHLARVQAGEEVLITDRGRPIARLVPAHGGEGDEAEGRVIRLARAGLLSPGSGHIPEYFWSLRRPSDPDSGVREALLDERNRGR